MSNYNLTNFTDANNILEIAMASNSLVGGLYMYVVICLIFAVSFMYMLPGRAPKDALLSSSFITAALTGVAWVAGKAAGGVLVTDGTLLVVFVGFIGALALHRLTE